MRIHAKNSYKLSILLIFILFSGFIEARETNVVADFLKEILTSENTGKTLVKPINELMTELRGKDLYTFSHCLRVAKYSQTISREMKLSEKEVEEISVNGLLHDIGKLAISDSILKKPGKLTPEEFDQIKKHPKAGVEILQKNSILVSYSKGAKEHHERWDGKGYPESLKGDQISLDGRIIAVADSFDAMTSQRPYNKPKNLEEALREIEAQKGSQFDPGVVVAFSAAVKKGVISIMHQSSE